MKSRNRLLQQLEGYLALNNKANQNLRWFRIGVYSVLLLKMLLIWPELSLFHQHGWAQHTATGFSLADWFFAPAIQPYYHWLWAVLCGIVTFAIFKRSRWLAVLVFFISLNYLTVAVATNAGDAILNFFVFSLLFVTDNAKQGSVAQLLNNGTLLLLKVQLCFVYFLNGYAKIQQLGWRDGSFLVQVWQLEGYANVHLIPSWFFNAALCFGFSWIVMLFELSFPIFIWLKLFRNWFIAIGLIFHIFIAVFLSIPDFSLTMMVAYLLFVDVNKFSSLKKQ